MKLLSKYISIFLHPIVLPTIATYLYFILSPFQNSANQVYLLISLVFLGSYLLPLSLLFLLKRLDLITDFNIKQANQRKIPLLIFMLISLILGGFIYKFPQIRALSLVFFGCLIALMLAYAFIYLKLKVSLHMIGISGFTTFFIVFSSYFNINILYFIILLIFLTGLIGTARLYLKAHSFLEIILGLTFGIVGILVSYYIIL